MIKLSKDKTKRLLSVHGWAGVALGLLLYVVVLTGAIVVFAHQIGQWSVSGQQHAAPLTQPLDADLRMLSQKIPSDYLEEVSIFGTRDGYVSVFFHTHKANVADNATEAEIKQAPKENFGARFRFDPATHQIISEHHGYQSDLPPDPAGSLENFLVKLHVKLHVPGRIGLYLTGILGLVLLLAAISGFFLHRHLFKEMFLSPRISSNKPLTARDKHNLAGTWGLPFSFVLAFTGAFFSFAISLGLPVIAMTAFGGDQDKAVAFIVGEAETANTTPASLTNIDKVVAESTERVGIAPRFINIEHWGRADAHIALFHENPDGDLYPSQHLFNGATGSYQGIKPQLGKTPSAGDDMVSLMGVLHFGTFAGLLSRIIWFALGLATCYVTLTGIQLWLRRREETSNWKPYTRLTDYVGYGLPIACATTAIGFFAAYPTAYTTSWTAWGFIIGCLLCAVIALVCREQTVSNKVYLLTLGISLIALPLSRMLFGGAGWLDLFDANALTVISMDIVFLIGGIACLRHVATSTNPANKNTLAQTSEAAS